MVEKSNYSLLYSFSVKAIQYFPEFLYYNIFIFCRINVNHYVSGRLAVLIVQESTHLRDIESIKVGRECLFSFFSNITKNMGGKSDVHLSCAELKTVIRCLRKTTT